MSLKKLISVARGEAPADLVIKNANMINVLTGEIDDTTVALSEEHIAGIGEDYEANDILDLEGNYLAPSFINGHCHLESSMLHPINYAKAVVPKGVSSVVSDLHEITNVAGLKGIEFYLEQIRTLPFDLFLMAPSCVPASPWSTSGAHISEEEIKKLYELPKVIGLGEMMNYVGVVNADEEVLTKIEISDGKIIDGHAPGLTEKDLNAYITAGIGSDHESTSIEEGKEKLRKGLHLMIREGSTERNLEELIPLINEHTFNRCMFVTDDKNCLDLLEEGDIDYVVRKAIKLGMDPIKAIQLATITPADYFGLSKRGVIKPGNIANLVSITDLSELQVDKVFYKGTLVAQKGTALFDSSSVTAELRNNVNIKPITKSSLKISLKETEKEAIQVPVIEIVPNQIITKKIVEELPIQNKEITSQPERDILKTVVIERHKASGNIGRGFTKGFGLKNGAIASSIAHDAHNLICLGTNDTDILSCIKAIQELGGGLVACSDGEVVSKLALPIAGLLSSQSLRDVCAQFNELKTCAQQLGELPTEPFSLLSFLALPVIPEIRLTDKGIVDLTGEVPQHLRLTELL